jgi:ribosomal protein L7/L12
MGLFGSSFDHTLAPRLIRIERQLQALLDHFQIELPDDGFDEVRQLAAAGKKIDAIKLYRQLTGAGLAEAKSFVERGL